MANSSNVSIRLDLRFVVLALLIIIVAMIALWRPWEGRQDRTVEVTGQATVTAVPDEFVFYPTYEFKNTDKQAALDALAKKSEEIVAKLKELGVADNKIKTNSDGHSFPIYKEQGSNTPAYTLRLTVTVDDKERAQKVQNYLITTAPMGAVSPQPTFSDKKRTELESKARDEATKDARAKAEQSAKNLGFSLGSVKTVNDGAGFNGMGRAGLGVDDVASPTAAPELALQPGENELTYAVTVTYFVR